MSRPIINVGLQEGDALIISTDFRQRVYVKAVRTRGGYVKLEVDMPPRFWVEKEWKRNEQGERIDQ